MEDWVSRDADLYRVETGHVLDNSEGPGGFEMELLGAEGIETCYNRQTSGFWAGIKVGGDDNEATLIPQFQGRCLSWGLLARERTLVSGLLSYVDYQA